MSLKINIDNYEEIMFRLVEDDFDESASIDLLQQIEADELFKFEWEAWQKTKFVDPLENYAIESSELTEKIILIAEPKPAGKKRFFYYWAAAASIFLLIGLLFLLTTDFTSSPKPEVVDIVIKSPAPSENLISPVQNQTATVAISEQKQFHNQKKESKNLPVVDDFDPIVTIENTLAEVPLTIDSFPVKADKLVKAPEKKSQYTITVETIPIADLSTQNNVLAQNRKVKLNKLFKNTRLILQRKENGEPDKIILVGDENNYLCINLNYTEK